MTTPYWSGDGISLYLGDCREIDAWLKADVLVTDPPYGVHMKSRPGDARHTKANTRYHIAEAIHGDHDTSARDDVLELWGDRPAIAFGSWRVNRPQRLKAVLIWHKEGAYSGPLNAAFFTNHEEIYVLGEGAWRKSSPPLRSVLTSTEHRSSAARIEGHPTPKPVGLMESLIDRCPPGVVGDPFVGSGSTLMAARNQGRQAIGVELEERYCEIAARRLDQGVLMFG